MQRLALSSHLLALPRPLRAERGQLKGGAVHLGVRACACGCVIVCACMCVCVIVYVCVCMCACIYMLNSDLNEI